MSAEGVHVLKAVSVLLQYPSADVRAAAAAIDPPALAGASRRQRANLAEFLGWFRALPVADLERVYVETFDFAKRQSLHLTFHTEGDRRQRGLALLRLKRGYAAAGLEATDLELPDYLPLMLEFAALAGRKGRDALAEHAVAIELVRASLHEAGSEYARLLDVVAEALPGLSARQLRRLRRLAAEGPPHEEVGLEPFAPPEVMPVEGAQS
jgi:nitrate reductase molybdenum cofactor assembly chaperone NarJ/NarW